MKNRMTIGWIEEFVRDGEAVEHFELREKQDYWLIHGFGLRIRWSALFFVALCLFAVITFGLQTQERL